ncbi:MAG: peptide chain release factor N(5)-glutamine methyltransferase [Patescibacteria group bacterium]|nr:peptide chain release factor N(5)-glutamine methyltransferase [Patescibacteria group bacterium]
MTVGEILNQYRDIEIELLLAHVLKKPKEFLFAHPEHKLAPPQYTSVLKLIRRRRKSEPIAYILGYKDFFGLRFFVDQRVLIPRPETEGLIELALKNILSTHTDKRLKILDLGTGSGCIIISFAKALQATSHKLPAILHASDVSAPALLVAKKNSRRHGVKINFVKSDLFDKLPGKFDFIVANLPYVPADEYGKHKSNLRFEPRIAITDGTVNWKTYKKFLAQLSAHVAANAKIFLEIDPKSAPLLQRQCRRDFPAAVVQIIKDLAGRGRFLVLHC